MIFSLGTGENRHAHWIGHSPAFATPRTMQTLRTPRLALEPMVAAHAAVLFPVLRDPSLYRYLDEAPPESEAQLRRLYAYRERRMSPDGQEQWLNWTVFSLSGHALGYVQATVLPDRRAWVAYVMGSAHWGRGLASEAVRAMIVHIAQAFSLQRCQALVEAANGPSIRLLQRLGFQDADEATPREHRPGGTERLYLLTLPPA